MLFLVYTLQGCHIFIMLSVYLFHRSLIDVYAIRGCLMILAGLCLHNVISGALLRPTSFYAKHATRAHAEVGEKQRHLLSDGDDIENDIAPQLSDLDDLSDKVTKKEGFIERQDASNGTLKLENSIPARNFEAKMENDANTHDDQDHHHHHQHHHQQQQRQQQQQQQLSKSNQDLQKRDISNTFSANSSRTFRENSQKDTFSFGSSPIYKSHQSSDLERKAVSFSHLEALSLSNLSLMVPPEITLSLASVARSQTDGQSTHEPTITDGKKENYSLLAMLCNFKLCMTALFLSCGAMGYVATVFLLPAFCASVGASKQQASLLLSVMGVVEGIGRVFWGYVSDLKCTSIKLLLATNFLIVGLASLAVTFVHSFPALVAFAVVYGLAGGIHIIFCPILIAEVVEVDILSSAIGYYFLISGALVAGIFPILGTHSFDCFGYCKSLKYSGNNKIAIIALCPYALL